MFTRRTPRNVMSYVGLNTFAYGSKNTCLNVCVCECYTLKHRQIAYNSKDTIARRNSLNYTS